MLPKNAIRAVAEPALIMNKFPSISFIYSTYALNRSAGLRFSTEFEVSEDSIFTSVAVCQLGRAIVITAGPDGGLLQTHILKLNDVGTREAEVEFQLDGMPARESVPLGGFLGMIFRLIEARHNEIRSQRVCSKQNRSVVGWPPRGAGNLCYAFVKVHLCRRRLPHLPLMLVLAAPAAGTSGYQVQS